MKNWKMTPFFRRLHWENKSCQNISDVYKGQRTRSLLIRWSGIKNIWLIISTFQWQQAVSDNKSTQLQNKSIHRWLPHRIRLSPALCYSLYFPLYFLPLRLFFSSFPSPLSRFVCPSLFILLSFSRFFPCLFIFLSRIWVFIHLIKNKRLGSKTYSKT